jgi:hypothetical protein
MKRYVRRNVTEVVVVPDLKKHKGMKVLTVLGMRFLSFRVPLNDSGFT